MIGRAFTAALLTGICLLPGSAAVADGDRPLTLRDRRISESSGLVDLGSVLVTSNDSGSPSKLFVIDARTGRTVGVTNFHAPTVDVEALAPAGGRTVWVGDIGDNAKHRKSVSVYAVTVRGGSRNVHARRRKLVYPHGPRNAESLFTDRGGRLYLITKSFKGGTVYRAPRVLRRTKPNRLVRIGRINEFVTDAAMLPDKRHILARGLGRASVYTFPQLRRVGTFALPRQRQGEGISVGPGSRIRLSSEGRRSRVLTVAIPAGIQQRMNPQAVTASPSASPSLSPSGSPSGSSSISPSAAPSSSSSPSPSATTSPPASKNGGGAGAPTLSDDPWLMWSLPAVIVLGAVGIGFGLRRRNEVP